MNPHEQDDIAKLAYGLASDLPKQLGIEAVAGMYNVTQEDAEKLIRRGRWLAEFRTALRPCKPGDNPMAPRPD